MKSFDSQALCIVLLLLRRCFSPSKRVFNTSGVLHHTTFINVPSNMMLWPVKIMDNDFCGCLRQGIYIFICRLSGFMTILLSCEIDFVMDVDFHSS